MKDARKLTFRSATPMVPEELGNAEYDCPKCGTKTRVPWFDKLEWPNQPIAAAGGHGHFVPISFPLKCQEPICANDFNIDIPTKPSANVFNLYGDEAGRFLPSVPRMPKFSANFLCLTLVYIAKSRQEEVLGRLLELKRIISPQRDPNTWRLHFTEIWNEKPDSKIYNFLGKNGKIEHALRMADLIREAHPELAFFNFSSCILFEKKSNTHKKILRFQKEDLLRQSLIGTLQQIRNMNATPRWTFDNIRDTSAGAVVEGWAKECFLGLQYTRLFTWLSAGSPVFEPNFVLPGSHFILEIADFISYCVAREFEKSFKGGDSEFPSSFLGVGYYQGTKNDGTIQYDWGNRFPLEALYGLRSSH